MLVEWSAPCQIKITTNSCPSLPPLLTSKQTFQKFFIYHTRPQMIEVMNEKDSKNPTFTPFK